MLPVIIAGSGPTGLALAVALARYRVPSLVLDNQAGPSPRRWARSCVLPPDLAHWARLPGVAAEATGWTAWHSTRRGRTVRRVECDAAHDSPLHVPQHALEAALRAVVGEEPLVRVVAGHRLAGLEQQGDGVLVRAAETNTPEGRERRWRGSFAVGCDGARSTVRKLLGVAFPGRTAVERYAVAALGAELPWPAGEGGVHRGLPHGEVTVRPLVGGRWRLDWPLPADGGLVTPETVLDRLHGTLAAWHDGDVPAYELLDTGVHICHQRLARRWRDGRVFLAGDAAHLLGALGTQQVAEGLRDVDNLAWKLAVACHEGDAETLLDSYEAERRTAVGERLRAVDQALPVVRGRGGLASRLAGRSQGWLALIDDGHLGRGTLGAPARYTTSPLAPAPARTAATGTPPGAAVADVPVTALDGSRGRLRELLGGRVLLLLTAPGARVWDARHWLSAGLMPALATTAGGLPMPADVLVTEDYPGAGPHTLLVVRPDGHLAAALPGTERDGLRACVHALRGAAAPDTPPAGAASDTTESPGSH
ncbi:FAD-dependent oxidoreductase [Streptomyces sp. 4N509B]|uniref:FAD-dependent oxidoreductase n=1 Tax=Streptomyces sp. 4N509B TaxID=3457413 RepID=UPI003FD2FC99